MTHERDIERLLETWLADGPMQVSDRVFDETVERVYRQRQRLAWRFLLRELQMSTPLKVALAATSLILVVSGIFLFARPSTQVTTTPPAPTPTAAPTSSPGPTASVAPSESSVAISCDDPAFACSGPLTVGTHSSVLFQPAVTFDVPAGWRNSLDRERAYTLHPPGDVFSFQIQSQVAIPVQNADCTAERKNGVGSTVVDWVQFLSKHPGLVTSAPKPVSIGGFEGVSLTYHVAATWTGQCPRSIGPAVVLVTDTGNPPDRSTWIDDHFSATTILDVAGQTVLIRLDSGPSSVASTRDQTTIEPIVASMRFDPGDAAPTEPPPSGPAPSR